MNLECNFPRKYFLLACIFYRREILYLKRTLVALLTFTILVNFLRNRIEYSFVPIMRKIHPRLKREDDF